MTLDQHLAIVSAGSRLGYQLCVITASVVGGWLIHHDARRWQISPRQYWTIMLIALLGALVGSTLPGFVAGGFVEEVAWTMPITPKTVMGGLLFSFLIIAGYKKIIRLNADTSDAFARGAICMMAIGRIGCILQHCCYGKAAAWGFDFGDGVARIPVQYIEATGLFALAYLIQHLHQHHLFAGRRLFLVFALYGALRFMMEFLREPIAGDYLGLGFYQWLALLIGVVGALQIVKRSPPALIRDATPI